jgi:hypothetical protein
MLSLNIGLTNGKELVSAAVAENNVMKVKARMQENLERIIQFMNGSVKLLNPGLASIQNGLSDPVLEPQPETESAARMVAAWRAVSALRIRRDAAIQGSPVMRRVNFIVPRARCGRLSI